MPDNVLRPLTMQMTHRELVELNREPFGAQESGSPFHLSEQLFNGMTVQEFCFKFTLGHHYKRHAKSKRGGGESCEESSTTAELDNQEKEPSPSTGKRKR